MLFDEFMELSKIKKQEYIHKVLFAQGLDTMNSEKSVFAFIDSLDKKVKKTDKDDSDIEFEESISMFEIRNNGPYDKGLFINGHKIRGIQDVKMHSELNNLTSLNLQIVGHLKGLDDLEHHFFELANVSEGDE
ncbi:hypothetical protein [Pediococcus pentosaceus]|uniref:hypothetical protein n=1 Tax=Pediococcus pentosaceus TaxID=1255 RepID=UPI0018A16D5A|nr:hypothetical protein [Pediococcus pentosaceus]MBF7109900.1 hypothetical protein [Pediococcus pentosaceus]QQA91571.1 hypothetical protein I6H68_04495 [Pediococcus pentosaceus]